MPETGTDLDFNRLSSDRARAIDASGIRRMFELAAGLENPINLTIGQPDFPVPRAIKDAVIDAIEADANGYTVTQGGPDALCSVKQHVSRNIGWSCDGTRTDAMLTSGTSGGLMLAALALLQKGDELGIKGVLELLASHHVAHDAFHVAQDLPQIVGHGAAPLRCGSTEI